MNAGLPADFPLAANTPFAKITARNPNRRSNIAGGRFRRMTK
jgi:hypothetical protein